MSEFEGAISSLITETIPVEDDQHVIVQLQHDLCANSLREDENDADSTTDLESKELSIMGTLPDGTTALPMKDGNAEHVMSDDIIKSVVIFWHGECLLHKIAGHPEQPDRVSVILTSLRKYYPSDCFYEAPLVTEDQVLLFHTPEHLAMLKKLFKESNDAFLKGNLEKMLRPIDGDTTVMRRTHKAAFRAAGSAIAAVDALFQPNDCALRARSAFCCVRPPGHHAERNRACGFCFLNNVGIASRYAQEKYGVKKVAVLDFDVHHGNGTEEGFTPDESLFYGSTHEKDNFPGSGPDPSPFVGDKAKSKRDRRIVNRTLSRGPISVPEFRVKWAEVIEEMVLFKPDFVIFSAGFDAHDEDPLADVELTEKDFIWATEIVFDACRRIDPEKHIPIMSVLEGGYDLTALASSALAHVNALAAGCEKTLNLNKNSKESSDLNKNAKETVNESSNLNEKLNRSIEESSNLNKSVNESVDVATAIGVSARDNYGGDEAAALAAYIADLKL